MKSLKNKILDKILEKFIDKIFNNEVLNSILLITFGVVITLIIIKKHTQIINEILK